MSRGDTALLVVDVQEKLVPAIADGPRVVWNVRRLIDGAKILGLPVVGTEQYPQGLGPTVRELAERLGPVPSKLTFSCGGCPELFEDLRGRGIHKILVCGIEAHVCVQQTVLDLLADGWRVYVAADAVGSRFDVDCRTALGGWIPPAPRSRPPRRRCSSGAKSPARRSSSRSASWRKSLS